MATPLQFEIPEDHPSLPGHFPGRPVVPGVVVLDRVFAAIEHELADAGTHALATVRMPQVKFVQPLLPGECARIELERVELERVAMDTNPPRWRFKVLRVADEALLASGEVHAVEGHAVVEVASA